MGAVGGLRIQHEFDQMKPFLRRGVGLRVSGLGFRI